MVQCPLGCGQEFTLIKWLAVGAAHVVWECPRILKTEEMRKLWGEEE